MKSCNRYMARQVIQIFFVCAIIIVQYLLDYCGHLDQLMRRTRMGWAQSAVERSSLS